MYLYITQAIRRFYSSTVTMNHEIKATFVQKLLEFNFGDTGYRERELGLLYSGLSLNSSSGQPGLSGGDCVVCGREWFVAVRRVSALGRCHGVVRRCAGCHGSR